VVNAMPNSFRLLVDTLRPPQNQYYSPGHLYGFGECKITSEAELH